MRATTLTVVGLLLWSPELNGQTSTTTTCSSYTPNSVNCQSHTTPDLSAQVQAENEATARSWQQFFAALQARRDRNALMAQQQQVNAQLAAERQALLAAELQRQAIAAQHDAAQDEAARVARAAEDERNQARLELFSQRADLIRQQDLNKNPLIGKSLTDYMAQTGSTLAKLFIANPLATNAEIREALGPVNAKFADQTAKFMQTFRTSVTLTAAQYKIPRRDFDRFRTDAWDAVMALDKFDIQTSPLMMRAVVDEAGQKFVKSATPVKIR